MVNSVISSCEGEWYAGHIVHTYHSLSYISFTLALICIGEAESMGKMRNCLTCGIEFTFEFDPRYPRPGKYCSRACYFEGTRNKKKPDSRVDKWGRTNMKADRDWKEAVRERDSCICQRCGRYDQYIHTHHVATRSQRPDLKHDVSNGVCLCSPCHQWVHRNPASAEKQGFLSNARYELARAEEARKKASDSLHKAKNTSGYRGVSWSKEKRKWAAYIRVGGRMIALGRYDNILDAHQARLLAEKKYGV